MPQLRNNLCSQRQQFKGVQCHASECNTQIILCIKALQQIEKGSKNKQLSGTSIKWIDQSVKHNQERRLQRNVAEAINTIEIPPF